MKYYIILQPTIRSMGGEEMYTRNIVLDACKHGYIPIVFHSGIGGNEIYIEDLKRFDKYKFPEFRYEPCVISNRKKNRLLDKVSMILGSCDGDSIIESHEMLLAEWGEILAKNFHIRHFAYMLLEHNEIKYKPLYDFLKFKYDRHELAGIAANTILDMFAHFNKHVIGYTLPAYCENVFEQIPCPKDFKLQQADYTIGSIGRTNKRYVQPMITSIINFTKKYNDFFFNILYVGGSMDKTSERLVLKRLSSIPNAKIYFTGMLFPLSVEMIKQMDVCIASAGSCEVSEKCGVPTISVDCNDSKAIGIFNKTTMHSLFRLKNESPIMIEKLLEEVLIEKKYVSEDRVESFDCNFSSHWLFLDDMNKNYNYYDINTINYSLIRRLKSFLLGYYYGLTPDSFKHRFIEKIISFFI